MNLLILISDFIMPSMILIIVVYGILNKVNVFESFIDGSVMGMKTVYNIFPTFIALMFAVGVIRVSGALNIFGALISPVAKLFGMPTEIIPFTIARLISSSAATGFLMDIFKNHGTDSYLGRIVSIMMCSTETIFYTMSVYFASVKITKTKYTLEGALVANIFAVMMSIFLTNYLF